MLSIEVAKELQLSIFFLPLYDYAASKDSVKGLAIAKAKYYRFYSMPNIETRS